MSRLINETTAPEPTATERLARRLLIICDAKQEQNNRRPIDKKIATAQFVGALEIAHVLGYGMTPFEVSTAVNGVYSDNGGFIPPTTTGDARRWFDKAVPELTALLDGMRSLSDPIL